MPLQKCTDNKWKYPCRFMYTIVHNDAEKREIRSMRSGRTSKAKRMARLRKVQKEWDAESSATEREDVELAESDEDTFDDLKWVTGSLKHRRVRLDLRIDKKRTDKKERVNKQKLKKDAQQLKKTVASKFKNVPKQKRDKVVKRRMSEAQSGLIEEYKRQNIEIRKKLRGKKRNFNDLLASTVIARADKRTRFEKRARLEKKMNNIAHEKGEAQKRADRDAKEGRADARRSALARIEADLEASMPAIVPRAGVSRRRHPRKRTRKHVQSGQWVRRL